MTVNHVLKIIRISISKRQEEFKTAQGEIKT